MEAGVPPHPSPMPTVSAKHASMTAQTDQPQVSGIELTQDDLLEGATRQYAAAIMRRRVVAFAILVALGGFAFGAYVVPARGSNLGIGLIVMAGALAYFYGLMGVIYLVVRRGIRRQWRENQLLHETVDVAWSGHGYKVVGENVRSDMPWSYYRGWRETRNLFLLYFSPVNYQILPKRYLSAEQEADLRRNLAAGGVRERKGLRS